MGRNVFFCLVSFLVFSACGPTLSPFTQKLYEQNSWKESDLRKIQFYLSEDIVLKREDERGYSTIKDGEIEVVERGELDQVIIRKGTPGVFLFSPKEDRFAVSFESSDERFLMFGPNPKQGNRYLLLASEWEKRGGLVTYGGKRYRVDSRHALATLMVDLKKVRKTSINSRTASGRKL